MPPPSPVHAHSHAPSCPSYSDRLANQQNSVNMAAERHRVLDAGEDFLGRQVFLTATTTAPPPSEEGGACPQVMTNGFLKDKRRLSKTSGASMRMRPDDIAV